MLEFHHIEDFSVFKAVYVVRKADVLFLYIYIQNCKQSGHNTKLCAVSKDSSHLEIFVKKYHSFCYSFL